MQRIIGIDFGTSTTYMNVKRYDGDRPVEDPFSYMPVVFNYGQSSGFVASIVRENADGTFDFGENASEQLKGAKIYSEIKMLLESPDEAQRSEARRVFKEFFKFLHETYVQQSANLGAADDTEETILSYPVKWKEETVQFMLEAARAAGFQNVHGMDEATAAVSAVLCSNASSNLIYAGKPGYLMLVDMGAGTTDLVVCKYRAEGQGDIRVELVTNWPQDADEPTFGGREIDAVLEQYVEDHLTKALTPALAPNAHAFASAPGQAKMWKERNVSVNLAANKSINTCAYIGVYRNTGVLKGEFPAFGRTEFEQIAGSGLHDYVRLLKGCLDHTAEKDPQFAADGLDLVVLTGGHSAWYFAREIVDGTMEGYLDHPSLKNIRDQKTRVVNLANPQTTVSLGLVYSKLPFTSTRPKPQPKPDEPAKPNEPINREVHPKPDGETYYKWRAQMVTLLYRYMRDHAGTVALHLRNSDSSDLRKHLNVPATDKVFLAHDDSLMKSGRCGFVVTHRGIYFKDSLGRPSPCLSWEDFMNGELLPDKFYMQLKFKSETKRPFTLFTLSNSDEKWTNESIQMEIADFFRGLQTYLRQASVAVQEGQELPDQPITPNKPEPPTPIEEDLFGSTIGGVRRMEYDPSRCPACGSAIARDAKKCPICGRKKLPELVTPYKFNSACWYVGEKKFGIEKASGPLTILDDRIELKRVFGNPPKAIFWMRDIVSVREGSYGLNAPSIVITMKDGQAHTFVPSGNHDRTRGAVALIRQLIRR